MRKITLSLQVMRWLVQVLIEASKEQIMTVGRWKTKHHFAEFFCTLKYNEHCRYASFIAVQGGSRSVIITPETTLNDVWIETAQ